MAIFHKYTEKYNDNQKTCPEYRKRRKTNFDALDQHMIPQYEKDLHEEHPEIKTQH